ncbi:MAG: hypothetical protein PHI48_04000 [Bacteroidales bacterium]|nr:hypothetical protein [Bacteroidales bacterium]
MKKLIIITVILLSSASCFAQFATFEPIVSKVPNSSNNPIPSGSSDDIGEVTRTTGYILSDSGSVMRKIQLKVSTKTTEFGESVRIIAYYNVIPGLDATWNKVSVRAQAIGGELPITKQQKVAYANFTYWAYWNFGKIWFK